MKRGTREINNAPRGRSLPNRLAKVETAMPVKASDHRVISKSETMKIQTLLASQTVRGMTAAFSRLQRLEAVESDWRAVFKPSVLKALAESWNTHIWTFASEGCHRQPEILASFEAAITTQFRRLSKPRQRAVLEEAAADLQPSLVRFFSGLVAIVNERSRRDDDLMFAQLQRLPAATAQGLVEYCRKLSFPRLKTLSDDAAAWLGRCENGCGLGLDALISLSDKAAASLAGYQGNCLSLAGLTSIPDASARALGGYAGAVELRLRGLRSISDTAASHLAKYKGQELNLSGLQTITDAAAAHLATYAGDKLDLSGLQRLSDTAASRLAKFKGGTLDLSGLRSLADQAIEALAKGTSWCTRLDGLRMVSEHTARFLERQEHNDTLMSLDGLCGRMPSVTAEALVRAGYSLTPNAYGWPMPTRIEIVFDCPVDIEMARATSSRNRGHSHATKPKPTDFWRISLDGKSYTVTEGRMGTEGRSSRKSFDGPKAALKSFAKAIWAKSSEGFEVVKQID